jgi:integrase
VPKTKLTTKGEIDALPHPATGQTLYWDTDLRGFGVLVGKRSKTFVLQRDVKGASRRITIGRYGETSLHLARQQAEQLAGEMRGGTDPVAERRAGTAESMTLREAWKLYQGHLAAKERSPVTGAGYWLLLQTHCADWLDRPLVEITREVARKRHIKIGTERGKYAANSTMRTLRAIWRRVRKQYPKLAEAPTANVDFYKEKPRTKVVKDLAGWWRGVQAVDNPIRRDLFIFLLFTGCRSGEAKTLRWDQVDLKAGRVHFPITKTDAFDLPLSKFLVDLFKARRACKTTRAVFGPRCQWVFPAHGVSGHVEVVQPGAKERKEFTDIWTPHTLRHTWITISENKVTMPPMHSRLLANHVTNSLGDAHSGYIHADLDDLRASQEKMSEFLVAATRPKPKPKRKQKRARQPKPTGNVVPFAKQAKR